MSFTTLMKLALFGLFHCNVSIAQQVGHDFVNVNDHGHPVLLPSYNNVRNSDPNKITHAVIFIHGLLKNAQGGFSILKKSLKKSEQHTTLIIAPQFITSSDRAKYALPNNTLTWGLTTWDDGGLSQTAAQSPISAFRVLTQIIAALNNRQHYPNLKDIRLIGFSAGGQFVQRYAFFHQTNNSDVRYWVISPSTYLYFNKQVDYKYGLKKLPGYLALEPLPALINRYGNERIRYFVGSLDHKRGLMLDKHSAANNQGPNRLARAKNYWGYLDHYYHHAPKHQSLTILYNVAHNQQACLLAAIVVG